MLLFLLLTPTAASAERRCCCTNDFELVWKLLVWAHKALNKALNKAHVRRPVVLICVFHLGGPVGLGHLPGGRDGVGEDLSIIGNPGAADALC